MNEQPNTELAIAVPQLEPASKRNRGSFQPGDPRINRTGRPKGADAAAQQAKAGRPLCGRIKTLFIPDSHLRARLAHPKAPWIINLPDSFRVVACDLDRARNGLVLTIYSDGFAAVQAGEPIPEFRPDYCGLKWVR